MATTLRFFSDFYDSFNQSAYDNIRKSDLRIKDRYIGKIRLDTLLSNRIVFTDAQILDGVFFNSIDPTSLVNLLNRSIDDDQVLGSIEIRSRSSSIKQSLLEFIKPTGSDKLKVFSFAIIKDVKIRRQVNRIVPEWPFDDVNNWRDILKIFKAAGLADDAIEEIETSWVKWFELLETGKILIHPWERERGFPIIKNLGGKNKFLDGISNESILDLGLKTLEEPHPRTRFDDNIQYLRKNLEHNNELSELQMLEARYHRAYNKALSWQHKCTEFESLVSSAIEIAHKAAHETDTAQTQIDDNLFLGPIIKIEEIDPSFLYKLGRMKPHQYQTYFFNNQTHLQQWWWHRDVDSLERAIDGLAKLMPYLNPEPNKVSDQTADIINLFTSIMDKYFIFPINQVLELFDISIKYYGEKSTKEQVMQRIIDIALEREAVNDREHKDGKSS